MREVNTQIEIGRQIDTVTIAGQRESAPRIDILMQVTHAHAMTTAHLETDYKMLSCIPIKDNIHEVDIKWCKFEIF